jgi:hypothetical protein
MYGYFKTKEAGLRACRAAVKAVLIDDHHPYSVIAIFCTLSIVHILIKLLHFGSWIFFRLQVKRGRTETLVVGPGLRLAQPGGPTTRVSVLPLFT